MTFVTVKKKYQVVIPAAIRRQLGIEVGDLLEVKADRGRIAFTPKTVVDRGITESLEDFKKGRSYGPFESAQAMIASLRAHPKKRPASIQRVEKSGLRKAAKT